MKYFTLFITTLFLYLSVINITQASVFNLPTNGIEKNTIELIAHTTTSPPSITIEWPTEENVTRYRLYRKLLSDTSWGNTILDTSSTTHTYVDTNVSTGIGYEYQIIKTTTINSSNYLAYGYIYTGIEMPLVENRGKIIFLVESGIAESLVNELITLENDLALDGWTVLRHNIASTSAVTAVKSVVVSDYQADPTNVKMVYIFGHVPVPYSGLLAPDGHGDHQGAWPADVYYGDINGIWTDSTVNNTDASRAINKNIIGDGKFDQSTIPSKVELGVGRVDMYDMPAFLPMTEVDLLRQYITKSHKYKWGEYKPERKGIVDDNFGTTVSTSGASGWSNFSTIVGGENIFDNVNYINNGNNFLLGLGCGGGSYTSAGGVGATEDFVTSTSSVVFNMIFGSYFGDWDSTNNFLRAPLASSGYGLTDVWSGRPGWSIQHMGLGETVGYSNLLTQNNDIGATHYYSNNDSSWGIHISLLGDPTLHTSIVDPATSTSGTIVGNNIRLGWVSSIDSQILGYNIYRSSSRLGPYEKINGTLIASTSNEYSILATSTEYSYMIRSVKLENTSSGSFYNQSQGQFITVPTIPNTFPSISSISNMSFAIGSNTIASSSFTISDVESSTTDLIISTNSSNQSLASSTGISITSTSNENIKNISISLSENVIGSSTITIFAFDGMATSSRSFNIEVYRVQEQVVPVVVSGGGGGGGGGAYNNTYLASSTTTNTPVETDVNNINNNEKIEFNYNFGYGSAGNDILFLQRFLIKNKFLEEKKDTGYFGALTKKALIAFQEKYSDEILKPNGLDHGTGYMGPATRTKINSLNNLSKTTLPYIFKKPLKMYDSGQDVKKLQEFLNNNGFIVSEIGPGSIGNETENFLSKTYNALIKFQMKYYKDIKTSDEEPPGSLGISTINKINQILFAPKY